MGPECLTRHSASSANEHLLPGILTRTTLASWALTGYDEVQAVSRDSETWSSQANGIVFELPTPEQRATLGLIMLQMDPPRHTEFRKLINKGFAPRQVARLNAHIGDMARQIVDDVIEQGECDFANDVAGALPSYVIAEMLGIPKEDGRRLYDLVEIINNGNYDGDDVFDQALTEMFQYATDLATRKRAQPGDDIATSLLQAEVDGQTLNDIEFNMFVLLLINAGGDTTRNLVAGGILALLENRDEWQRLTADPSLMPSAIEEMLRYVSPVMVFVRTATRTPSCGGYPSGRASGQRCSTSRRTATRPDSAIPTDSTSAEHRIPILPSAVAEPTSASVPTSRARKLRRSFLRCSSG